MTIHTEHTAPEVPARLNLDAIKLSDQERENLAELTAELRALVVPIFNIAGPAANFLRDRSAAHRSSSY